mgnify:CR=1 FL=1
MTLNASVSEIMAGFKPFVRCFSKIGSPVSVSIALQLHFLEPLSIIKIILLILKKKILLASNSIFF